MVTLISVNLRLAQTWNLLEIWHQRLAYISVMYTVLFLFLHTSMSVLVILGQKWTLATLLAASWWVTFSICQGCQSLALRPNFFALGFSGLGLEFSGLGINNKANRPPYYINNAIPYWVILHWISTSELPSTCHKGLAYLITYLTFSREQQKWLNWKTVLTLAFTGKIYFCILSLDLGSVTLHVSGLGLLALALALTPLALLTSLVYTTNRQTDGHQIVTLCLLLDTISVIMHYV